MSVTSQELHSPAVVANIQEKARRLGIYSMISTTAAGSGHPTSCLSAAQLVAGAFFYAMKFDPKIRIRRMATASSCPRVTRRHCSTLRLAKQEYFQCSAC